MAPALVTVPRAHGAKPKCDNPKGLRFVTSALDAKEPTSMGLESWMPGNVAEDFNSTLAKLLPLSLRASASKYKGDIVGVICRNE